MLPLIAKAIPKVVGSAVRANPVGLVVRGGRFLYIGSAGLLTFATYTAWKNQNSNVGFFETLKTGDWKPESADKPRTQAHTNGNGKGPAAGVNGDSTTESFNERRYNKRLQAITVAGRAFGVHVTSGVRSASENQSSNGVSNSLHLEENGGLAFDLSSGPGAISPQERSFYTWARQRADLFQEVLLHNSGSGWHVHVAFRSDVVTISTMATVPGTGVSN